MIRALGTGFVQNPTEVLSARLDHGATSIGTALERLHSLSESMRTALCALHRRNALLHVSRDGLEFLGGAELEVLGGELGARDVGVREVEGVPGLVDLFAIPEVEDQLALEDVAQCGQLQRSSGRPRRSDAASTSSRIVTNWMVVPSTSSWRSSTTP